MASLIYNVLIIEDQQDSVQVFRRRFENHSVIVRGTTCTVKYSYLQVELEPREGERWQVSEQAIQDLARHLRETSFDLLLIDYSFVPPELDEELTYKLSHKEIHAKEELLGKYVLDAAQLFDQLRAVPQGNRLIERINAKIIMYTYPADSLMHLLGDARTRQNVLARSIGKPVEALDTRQLLYGGDKSLEEKHDRRLYPQLLIGYLNQRVLIEMQRWMAELPPGRGSVILVHGIRTRADWYSEVRRELLSNGFTVHMTNYGRFDVIRFLVPVGYFRRQVIRKVGRQIRAAIQEGQTGEEHSIIAHSFGTYVIASILQSEFDLRFGRIIFAGSVVRYDFPFEQLHIRFNGHILNEACARDPWPAIAESVTFGYGSAGTFGFKRPYVTDRWHGGGHSDVVNARHCGQHWVPFLKSGEVAETSVSSRASLWINAVSILRIKYWILAVACYSAYLLLFTR